jgi:AraC-like DNA-binding protein
MGRSLMVQDQDFTGSDRPQSFGSIPSATGGIARLACDRMRKQGKDPATLLSEAGLTRRAIDDCAIRVEVRSQIKLLELVARELDDELLGFHLALDFDLREIGLVYYVMASSELLSDALQNAARFSAINNEGARLRVVLDGTAAIMLDYINVDRGSDLHQAEFWLVTMVRICRKVTNGRLVPLQLKLRHFREATPAEFKAFFGTDVTFAADGDAIVWSKQVAALPLVGRDGYLNNLLRGYAEQALANMPREPAGLRADVEKILPALLPHGRANPSEIARQLGMSSRTLSRRLRQQGMTYASILDDFRANLARRYLNEKELPVSEVAWLLGYREFSSLTHAFKRWTGMTPRQFRSREAGPDGEGSAPETGAAGEGQ